MDDNIIQNPEGGHTLHFEPALDTRPRNLTLTNFNLKRFHTYLNTYNYKTLLNNVNVYFTH